MASRIAALLIALATLATTARLAALPGAAAGEEAAELAGHLRNRGQPPLDYVLARLADHRVVLLGEHHRLRPDPELVAGLVPRLREAGVSTLAAEILPAARQEEIDGVVAAERWDQAAAMGLMRQASWPYREYLAIVEAVWRANAGRPPGAEPLRLLALGPGADWRERLPAGTTYDTFMADRLLARLRETGGRALVYSGLHHAFTRYRQPERPRGEERVERFFERAGNVLWRELGEEVFLILLHRPWQCRPGGAWTYCLPVGGALDCAAETAGGRPVGFDLAGSPFAELKLAPADLYARGYPAPRLIDLADGYVWSGPIDATPLATLIPVAEYAPGEAGLREALAANPFTDDPVEGREGLAALWRREEESHRDPLAALGWRHLADWRTGCAAPRE